MDTPRTNPYAGPLVHRSYHAYQQDHLVKLRPAEGPPDALATMVHTSFRAMALSDTYPCVVARSAMRRGDYRFGCYAKLGTPEATASLAADLWDFISEFPIVPDRFASFVATFDGPATSTEKEFETQLWEQLQLLHDADVQHSEWDPSVSTDPHEFGFSFSFGGRAFFIVGMHAAASRFSRRTAWPTLIFNSHEQFNLLRLGGRMDRMKDTVRKRDRRLQGSENPSLAQFDKRWPETVMYSGRLVEDDWKCPLHIHQTSDAGDPRVPAGTEGGQ